MSIPIRAVPGYESDRPGPHVATKISHRPSADDVKLVKQLGLEWVMVDVPHDDRGRPAEPYRTIRERFDEYGLRIYRLTNTHLHNMAEVTLGLPGRDELIDQYRTFIREVAEVGVHYITYAHMANGIWSSPREVGRGGTTARAFHMDGEKEGWWVGREYPDALSHGRECTEEELWQNYEYFIRAVTPAAEEHGVRIGIHPDDPPLCTLGGIPRVLFSSYDGYLRALEIADSPNIGVCLCCGCWLEGGAKMGATVEEAINAFASRDKLFKVHLRNVTAPMPEGFRETFPDEGYGDFASIARALVRSGFDGAVISDHLPDTVGGSYVAEAYSVAYIKGVLDAARPAHDNR
jgi:mannonate dehydratase